MVLLPTLLRYGVVGVGIAFATWFALSTYDRAREADRLESQIAQMKSQQAAQKEFDAKVDEVRQTFETRMNEFNVNLAKMGEQRRERIIERIPENTRVCLTADVVRLLNDADGDKGRPAEASAGTDGAADNITIPALP